MVTCLDGYAMARQGRAGAALGIAAFGSFIAGVIVTIALFLVGPALADFALAFGPAEYTALVLLGLLLVTQLSSGSQIDALLMVAFGLLLSTVGKDPIYGTERFTFDIFSLFDGLNIALLAMGVFGVAELLVMAEGGSAARQAGRRSRSGSSSCSRTAPTGARARCRSCAAPGSDSSSACCRAAAPRCRRSPPTCWSGGWPRSPERFGHGAIEGVAGPEIGQQRGRAVVVRAAAEPRHPGQCRHGRDPGRAADPGHHARARRWSPTGPTSSSA